MKYDLPKTQFLIVDNGTTKTIKAFKRRRTSMLFGRDGHPQREISHKEWRDFQAKYPDEIAQDGLKRRDVWTLVEIRRTT